MGPGYDGKPIDLGEPAILESTEAKAEAEEEKMSESIHS